MKDQYRAERVPIFQLIHEMISFDYSYELLQDLQINKELITANYMV